MQVSILELYIEQFLVVLQKLNFEKDDGVLKKVDRTDQFQGFEPTGAKLRSVSSDILLTYKHIFFDNLESLSMQSLRLRSQLSGLWISYEIKSRSTL